MTKSPTPHAPPDIHQMIAELTRAHSHAEKYTAERNGTEWHGSTHITQVPSLVHQLLGANPASQGSNDGASAFGSRPAARIEPLDTIMFIDQEASAWIKRLGEDDPGDTYETVSRTPAPAGPAHPRCPHQSCTTIRRGDHLERRRVEGSGTISCLRKLHGLHASAKPCGPKPKRNEAGAIRCCTAHHIEADIRHWWHQARIITGWDSPAYRPFNTCPVCEVRGTLRVNVTVMAALCVDCRTVWDPDQIGLLAEHIRFENGDTSASVGTTSDTDPTTDDTEERAS